MSRYLKLNVRKQEERNNITAKNRAKLKYVHIKLNVYRYLYLSTSRTRTCVARRKTFFFFKP